MLTSRPIVNKAIKMAASAAYSSSFAGTGKIKYYRELPKEQKAFKIREKPEIKLEEVQIPVPTPKPNEVLLKIAAAGMCHTDLHILAGGWSNLDDYVLGHEISGRVVGIGSNIDAAKYPENKLFAVHGSNGCGKCRFCREGQDHQCQEKQWYGLAVDGGYQEYIAVRERSCIPVPENLTPMLACATTDAVLTPYHCIKRARVGPNDTVLVIGLGGLGINAVQIAKVFGCKVIATDLRKEACDSAINFGADEVYQSSLLPEEGLDVDSVLDVVASDQTFQLAQKHVRIQGTIVPVGLHDQHLTLNTVYTSLPEVKVEGTYWGTSQELKECLDMVSKGVVTPQVESTKFERVNDYLKQLEEGKIKSRLAFVPGDE